MLPKVIYVRDDDDEGGLLIVGEGDIAGIDADDGDKIAVYERREIRVYRRNPRLEAVARKR